MSPENNVFDNPFDEELTTTTTTTTQTETTTKKETTTKQETTTKKIDISIISKNTAGGGQGGEKQ